MPKFNYPAGHSKLGWDPDPYRGAVGSDAEAPPWTLVVADQQLVLSCTILSGTAWPHQAALHIKQNDGNLVPEG